jgi:hypothetical protein
VHPRILGGVGLTDLQDMGRTSAVRLGIVYSTARMSVFSGHMNSLANPAPAEFPKEPAAGWILLVTIVLVDE